MSNTSINLVSLDPDSTQTDLQTYLQSQSVFKDFNFEGSNMAVLLDLLAHNTFKQNFYLNMAISEAFIDSAQISENIKSNAKDLNYIPMSATSAKATVSLSFTTNPNSINSDVILIPKGTSFNTVINNSTFTFTVPQNYFYVSNNNSFNIPSLDIYEGTYQNDTYVMDYNNSSQRFFLSNPSIDISTIVVNVIEDSGSTILNYLRSDTLLGINSTSQIFMLQSGINDGYEILFGNNIVGRMPKNSAIIQIIYRVSSGSDGNGASIFSLNTDIGNGTINSTVNVQTISISCGGADPEGIESIRTNAPRYFQIQDRAIVSSDYELLLKYNFPEIKAVHAYGGEQLNPPQFGKIFISTYLYNLTQIPNIKITEYTNFIQDKCSTNITPVFINPEFTYYGVNSTVNYNTNLTTLLPTDIQTLVLSAIDSFNNSYLNDFNVDFLYSKFIFNIDSAHPSIISNDTDIFLYKSVSINTTLQNTFTLNFGIPLKNQIFNKITNTYNTFINLKSDVFTFNGANCYIGDDGNGNVNIYDDIKNVSVFNGIGTINYTTGIITIKNLYVQNILNGTSFINFYVIPASKDFTTIQNQILTYQPSFISLNIVPLQQ